jgi:hypothetical protein
MPSLKIGIYLGAFLAFSGLLWYAHHSGDRAGYKRATDAMALRIAQANEAARASEIKSRESVEAVDRAYQLQLESLDARYRDAANRLGPVRVSKCPAGGVSLSGSRPAASVPDGASSPNRLSGNVEAEDIGPALVDLMKQADEQTQRLIACQAYVKSTIISGKTQR